MAQWNSYAATVAPTDDDLLLIMDAPGSVPAMRKLAFGDARTVISRVVTNVYTANRTIGLADLNRVVAMNVAGANTITVPPFVTVAFAEGDAIGWEQHGAGITTITPGSGVVIRSRSNALTSAGQWAGGVLRRLAANDEWIQLGDVV